MSLFEKPKPQAGAEPPTEDVTFKPFQRYRGRDEVNAMAIKRLQGQGAGAGTASNSGQANPPMVGPGGIRHAVQPPTQGRPMMPGFTGVPSPTVQPPMPLAPAMTSPVMVPPQVPPTVQATVGRPVYSLFPNAAPMM